MGKMLSLTHFQLEPGCEDYSFLDKAVEDFEHGLDSILTDSVNTQELDASFDEADAVPSSVSLAFLYLVRIISDNSRLQLAPTYNNLITYGTMLGHYFYLYLGQVDFSVTQQHLDSGLLCHLIPVLCVLSI